MPQKKRKKKLWILSNFVSKSIASKTQRTSFTGLVHETRRNDFLCTSCVKTFCDDESKWFIKTLCKLLQFSESFARKIKPVWTEWFIKSFLCKCSQWIQCSNLHKNNSDLLVHTNPFCLRFDSREMILSLNKHYSPTLINTFGCMKTQMYNKERFIRFHWAYVLH